VSCQILDLTLGPLHLDLLGLVVDLNQVHLQITAQQGQGNLLCAVAGCSTTRPAGASSPCCRRSPTCSTRSSGSS